MDHATETALSALSGADTVWMIVATALVLPMTPAAVGSAAPAPVQDAA